MKSREEILEQFSKLLDVMDDLRSKCPWDREQTMETIRSLTIEETYELSDAIIQNDLTERQLRSALNQLGSPSYVPAGHGQRLDWLQCELTKHQRPAHTTLQLIMR